jgi:hypothetical protein
MTQGDLGLAVSMLILVAGFTLYEFAVPLRNEKRKTQRYQLFACRHRIVMLVADGKIDEDDEAFQFLYQSVNYLIPHAPHLSRLDIVRAAFASPISKLADDEFRERFVKMLNHDDPAVRHVAHEFFAALAKKLSKIWSVKLALLLIAWGLDKFVASLNWISRVLGASPRDGAKLIEMLETTNAELAAA